MKVELAKVKGEMQTMNRKMADGISTPREETTESRGSVDVVRTAMTTDEVEVTSDVAGIKRGDGNAEIKRGGRISRN